MYMYAPVWLGFVRQVALFRSHQMFSAVGVQVYEVPTAQLCTNDCKIYGTKLCLKNVGQVLYY
jgi:hypothetical protein